MDRYPSPFALISAGPAWEPVFCARPQKARDAARFFLDRFPGDVLYAVKVNPAPWMIDALYAEGVRFFDVASEDEIDLIASRCPDARMAFLHPVKSRRAIRRAYFDYGVRIFALDCEAELRKIVEETDGARDLHLIVRMAVSGEGSALPLSGKFGAPGEAMPGLLRAARAHADELGVSFHVGSQCMDPGAYRIAMAEASLHIVEAGVTVDIVDVGGGFPASYPGLEPPPLDAFMTAIESAFEEMMVLENADLWCEPGRALAAEAASLLARVELVKDRAVHLNDGSYGALYDAAHERWRYPIRVIRGDAALEGDQADFDVYGPTCDSSDRFADPLALPEEVREGDYVEFGNLGAYGETMATRFNGFGRFQTVLVDDSPFASLYRASAEVVAFPGLRSGARTW